MRDWRFFGLASLLAATAALSAMSERRPPQALIRPLDSVPTQLGSWKATGEETLGAEIVDVLKPTSYLTRLYRENDKSVGLFIAFYASQTAGATLHSPKNCLPSNGWEVWKQASLKVPTASGPLAINRYSVRKIDDKVVIYYWYQSKDRIVASEIAGKFFLIRDSLFNGHTAAALVRLTLPDVPTADQNASDFAARVVPEIQACFPK